MSAPRVPPVPPEKEPDRAQQAGQHRRVGKVEKIEKTSEVDDEARARQFRKFVEEEPEELSNLPTPFSLFTAPEQAPTAPPPISLPRQDPTFQQASENSLPTPTSAPPPSAAISNTVAGDDEEDQPLPRSGKFWGAVDEPPDETPSHPQMSEGNRSKERVFKAPPGKESFSSVEKKKDPPFAGVGKMKGTMPYGKPDEKKEVLIPKKGEKPAEPFFQEEDEDEEPTSFPQLREGKLKEEFSRAMKEKEPPFEKTSPFKEEKKRSFQEKSGPFAKPTEEEKPKSLPSEIHKNVSLEKKKVVKDRLEKEGKEKEDRRKDDVQRVTAESPTLTPLVPDMIPIATAAATQATPYLGPEALAIYFHMVGTIAAMVSPKGDSRTEFILNSPSFANSKFFGSTIAIERFSTAPYQLNIVLTGSNEAVALFNKNIPNLLAAFKNSNFSFTINRIEAVYRPVFHRKEAAKGKGFGEGFETRKE